MKRQRLYPEHFGDLQWKANVWGTLPTGTLDFPAVCLHELETPNLISCCTQSGHHSVPVVVKPLTPSGKRLIFSQ